MKYGRFKGFPGSQWDPVDGLLLAVAASYGVGTFRPPGSLDSELTLPTGWSVEYVYRQPANGLPRMIEASIRVHLPCSWVTLLTVEHGAAVNLVGQKEVEEGLLQSLVEIEPGDADPGVLMEALEANDDVVSVESIVPPKGKILAAVVVRDCRACRTLAASECFLTDATALEGGGLVWHILGPQREAVEQLVASLQDRGLQVEVASIRDAKTTGMLTERQEEVIGLAYQLGYFDFPKRISLTELADRMGVAKSTLSEILRTGEAKVLHAYFHGLMKRPR